MKLERLSVQFSRNALLVAALILPIRRIAALDETPPDGPEACRRLGREWEDILNREAGQASGRFTEIVFLDSGTGSDANVCYYNRDYGVFGDPIYVGVVTQDGNWTAVRFEPCAVESAAPHVLASDVKQGREFAPKTTKGWKLVSFLPRRCFSKSIDVTIIATENGKPVLQRFPLMQYDRYRGTVQGGVVFSKLHDDTFGLRPGRTDATKQEIYDKGPAETGPEYIATINIYSVLRYLPSLFGRGKSGQASYAGRDPIHEQDFVDRLGLVLGAGLNSPTHRFLAGASFELVYGISLIGVIDYARVTRLADRVSTDRAFTGSASDIPTKYVWMKKPAFGISMDARYLAALLTGK